MKLNFSKKSKGFTLVEILLVVGFIALASIGIYAVYSKVQTSNKSNEEGKNLETMRAGIKNLYGGQTNYATLTTAIVANSKVAPLSMINAATLRNSFGGLVTVAPASVNGGVSNAFTITYAGVPSEVCMKLVASSGASFDGLSVGGTAVKVPGTANAVVNVATASTQCAAFAAAGGTMIFTSF